MERRTLLRNLFASAVIVPTVGRYATNAIASPDTLVEPDDEVYMKRAIRLAGNVPKFPFGALLVDEKRK